MLPICLTSVVESRNGCSGQLELWIGKFAAGADSHALADLYHCTSAAVYAFALSIVKNTYDAEDVLHDCYVKVFSAAQTYRPCGKPMAWIMAIARNLCLHKLREHQRTADFPAENWEEALEAQETISHEDRIIIRECMNRLSEEERQIVVLHAASGFKHREIAQVLELPLPTVLSKYHRAIKKIQKYL